MRAIDLFAGAGGTTPLRDRRAREALQAARIATERDKRAKANPLKRCASCGAAVHHQPA